jgi:hypothetical protein
MLAGNMDMLLATWSVNKSILMRVPMSDNITYWPFGDASMHLRSQKID